MFRNNLCSSSVEIAYIESTALELDKYVLISKIQKTEEKQYTFCTLTDITVGKTFVDTGLSKRRRHALLF